MATFESLPRWLLLPLSVTLMVAAAWLVAVIALTVFQRDLLYLAPREEKSPAAAGLPSVRALRLTAPDGATIAVWSSPAAAGVPTIMHFHGNGGSHAILAGEYRRLIAAGYGLFAPTYRGYPGATGQPSEAANVADAVMAYDALVATGVKPSDIVLYGESLGSGVAVQLAGQRQVAAVFLESPYPSIADIAAREYWFVPVDWLLADRYDSIRHAKRVTAPVLILHGSEDRLIPIAYARRLYDAFAGAASKRFVELPGGHVMLSEHGGFEAMQAFLGDVIPRGGASSARGATEPAAEPR